MQNFEILDHTADVGVAATGATREELFENAALGMMSIVTDAGRVRPSEARAVCVEADDPAALLAAFLSELLYLLEVERFVVHHVAVESVSDRDVSATAHGEEISPRHEFHAEIKAVTHHGLTVEQKSGRWHATVLFDI